MKQNGNIGIAALIFIALLLIFFFFLMAIFMSQVNSTLYNLKMEIYSINKSAIIAVNKNTTNIDNFTYHSNTYREYFEKMLQINYDLDENGANKEKLIQEITILEYTIYEKGKKDSITQKRCTSRTIHTVIRVKIKPILSIKALENLLLFNIHEDVALENIKM